MNSRERISRAVRFQMPDWVAYCHRFLDATRTRYPELVARLEFAILEIGLTVGGRLPPPAASYARETGDTLYTVDAWACVRITGSTNFRAAWGHRFSAKMVH